MDQFIKDHEKEIKNADITIHPDMWLQELQDLLRLKDKIVKVDNFKDFEKAINNNQFVEVPFNRTKELEKEIKKTSTQYEHSEIKDEYIEEDDHER